VLPDLIRLPQAWQSHRVVERELGREIARRRADGERVATEMPRLEYFAGQKPGPPRPISAREILAAARAPETRFVAIVAKRTPIDEAELRLLGYAPLTLDPRLEQLTLDAEVRSYERRRR
jgi:hypothetical protein